MSNNNPYNTSTLLQKLTLTAVTAFFFVLTMTSAQEVIIDETMPESIPAEIIADWKDQDGTDYASSINNIKNKFPEITDKIVGLDEDGYLQACHWRRVTRMKKFAADLETLMFCRHHNFGGIRIGYHDNVDTSYSDAEWVNGGALCILTMRNYYSAYTELLAKTDAVVRDPCISLDGKKVLFAMSGNGKGTGYKIYEMEIADTATVTQLTSDPKGRVVADFEPCYLPNGDIMFVSTRHFRAYYYSAYQTTNMFLMNSRGDYMRQVGFDQAYTFYPVLMDDGTVLYSRWEYNDRTVTDCMGLFMMNPDGTRQTEYFGNQTAWPTFMIHARPIPGSGGNKVLCIASGHHAPYSGELMLIDRTVSTNGKQYVQMIAPRRETEPDGDHFPGAQASGGVYFISQTPYPLDDEHFLVSWRKSESESKYRLYFMDIDGNRELLAWADQSVSQPVSVRSRNPVPPEVKKNADYNASEGTYFLQNVYYGNGMKGVEKTAAKTLRVVKLRYRAAGMGVESGVIMGTPPSGVYSPVIFQPVSAYSASIDAKEVLGEAKIYEDGSAAFKVPARTPVYFQVLDSMGYCIATMRSWSTLMPGEIFSCLGCHENKCERPPDAVTPMAQQPKELSTPLGIENKPFDYNESVQPIFDEHCVKCHTADHESGFDLTSDLIGSQGGKQWTQSYISLTYKISPVGSNTAINICTIFSEPVQQPPYSFGSSLSGIMLTGGLSGNHHDVQVTQTERKTVACWIDLCAPYAGKYDSYLTSDTDNYAQMEEKCTQWAAIEEENISAMLDASGIISGDHGCVKSAASVTEKRIRYLPTQHALVVKKHSPGNVMVMNLLGRIIYRMQLSEKLTEGKVTISLPEHLSTGLYITRFEGIDGNLQSGVFIIR